MVTSLSTGDKIHVGESVTLTLLTIVGNVIYFGIESQESDGHGPNVLIEGAPEADLHWWELN
jgi:hypothetical protein